jgi:hypothetical protein
MFTKFVHWLLLSVFAIIVHIAVDVVAIVVSIRITIVAIILAVAASPWLWPWCHHRRHLHSSRYWRRRRGHGRHICRRNHPHHRNCERHSLLCRHRPHRRQRQRDIRRAVAVAIALATPLLLPPPAPSSLAIPSSIVVDVAIDIVVVTLTVASAIASAITVDAISNAKVAHCHSRPCRHRRPDLRLVRGYDNLSYLKKTFLCLLAYLARVHDLGDNCRYLLYNMCLLLTLASYIRRMCSQPVYVFVVSTRWLQHVVSTHTCGPQDLRAVVRP